jgi:hypothetical protein
MPAIDIMRRAIEILLSRLRSVAAAAESQLLYPTLTQATQRKPAASSAPLKNKK